MSKQISEHYLSKIGEKYHSITIINFVVRNGYIKIKYKCDCGQVGYCSPSKKSKQCIKCYHKSLIKKDADYKKNEYKILTGIKYRCLNPKSLFYKNYGGRGIKLCERWQGKEGFKNFINDMGNRPSLKHSIDRIDNNGNYEPNNCKWSTQKEQIANKRLYKETSCVHQKKCVVCQKEIIVFKKRIYCGRTCQSKAYLKRKQQSSSVS